MPKQPAFNLRWLLAGFVAIFYTFFIALFTVLGSVFHAPRSWLDQLSRLWAKRILQAARVRVEVTGLEYYPEQAAILVGNHQGALDILALNAYLPQPPVFVAKQEIFRIPLMGRAMTAFGHIAVNRKDSQKAIESINQGAAKLRQSCQNVVFFPEGTRTRDGQMLPFKKGAFVFALQSQLPIVPFAIVGSYEALPPKKKVLNPGTIRVQFLPPIDPSRYTLEQRELLTQDTYAVIEQAVQQIQADYSYA